MALLDERPLAWAAQHGAERLTVVGVLALRHLVLPAVGEFRAPLAELLGERLGVAVAIERIDGGWAGWRPRLRLAGVSLADAQGRPVLTLPEVDATLAWSSLAMLEPHFHRLEIRAPDLTVRRDAAGALHVAGIELAPGEEGDRARAGRPGRLRSHDSRGVRRPRIEQRRRGLDLPGDGAR